MAQIELNIPNSQIGRVVDALCVVGSYSGDPDDAVARREFALGVLREYLRETVLRVERTRAATAAMSSVTVSPVTIE